MAKAIIKTSIWNILQSHYYCSIKKQISTYSSFDFTKYLITSALLVNNFL